MLSKLFSWLTGGVITSIGEQVNLAYKNKLDAQNAEERIEADKRIAEVQAMQAVLIAEQGRVLTAWIRPAFALVFLTYITKVVVWDKVLGLGVTDPLGGYMEEMLMLIMAFYFFGRPFEKRR